MAEEATVSRMRAWSAVRWVLVGVITVVQGVSGWYFTLFDVYGLDDFDGSLGVFMLALPTTVLLIAADFRTAVARGALWAWIVLRAVAVPMLGLGAGSLVRVRLFIESDDGVHRFIDSHAGDYAWQLAALGAALLAIQPLVAGVRRIAVAVFGAPRATVSAGESSAGEGSAEEASNGRHALAHVGKWPGPPMVKAVAGTVAFVLIAGVMLSFAGRVHWHIAVSTAESVPPMIATGTVDGREIAAVGYNENTLFRHPPHQRVAAYDLASGELVWDRRIPNEHRSLVTVDVILVDERGAFLRKNDPTRAATWFVLDPRTGEIGATAEEGNLQVIDDLDEAAPGIPGDVVERYTERHEHVSDDGYDHEFTDDADIERVFRYEDESLLINPVTGRPAGEDHGFTLHGVCCDPPALESRAEDGSVLWRIDDVAASTREVVAETEDGHVVVLVAGPESKGRLISAREDGFTEAVVGDRGWSLW